MRLVSRPVERVPGDKSISRRAVLLGAVACGVTEASSPVPWRDVCLTNRDRLTEVIADFETKLKHLRRLVDDANGAELGKLFRRARDYRRCLNAGD